MFLFPLDKWSAVTTTNARHSQFSIRMQAESITKWKSSAAKPLIVFARILCNFPRKSTTAYTITQSKNELITILWDVCIRTAFNVEHPIFNTKLGALRTTYWLTHTLVHWTWFVCSVCFPNPYRQHFPKLIHTHRLLIDYVHIPSQRSAPLYKQKQNSTPTVRFRWSHLSH